MSAQESNTVNQTREQLQSWLDYIKEVPSIEMERSESIEGYNTIHEDLLNDFCDWFYCYTTTKGGCLVHRSGKTGLHSRSFSPGDEYPRYVIQVRRRLEDKTLGQSSFFFFTEEFDDEAELEEFLDGGDCEYETFCLLNDESEHEVAYRIYAPKGQDFQALCGQYKRDNMSSKPSNMDDDEKEIFYHAALLKKVEVEVGGQQDSDEEELRELVKLGELVKLRKQTREQVESIILPKDTKPLEA
ncbi:hypothetical protein NHQ30_008743 [Ciborinia camelliae]|nr:hypothetical protein NHQ30_008743 [Ciborinia camelliae]